MSGQWEVVGKSKKKQNVTKPKPPNNTEQKWGIENGSAVEEISMPLSPMQSSYDALSKDVKENKKPGKENIVKDDVPKKPQKKPQNKKKDPPPNKPVFPKSLDTAVKLINKKELCSQLELEQARFPDALVWLKGLVGYMNTKLTVENVHPTFEGKHYEYPQNLLPLELRDVLKRSLMDSGSAVAQTLFEWCLTAMASDLSRDKSCGAVLGYKLILQLLAFYDPKLTVRAIPKMKTLLDSYHNRQSIGLSLLWAVGQGGYRDLDAGLQVWQEVMFPLVDLRLYSAYVVSYIQSLLGQHPCARPVRADILMSTLRVLCSPPENVPANRCKELRELSSKLMARILELPYEGTFLPAFPILLQNLEDTAPARLQRELENVLLTGLLANTRVSTAWLEVYPELRSQSRLLLQHLGKNWNKVPKNSYNSLQKMLCGFQRVDRKMEKEGISDPHIQACGAVCKELQRRMAIARPSSRFPWLRANLLLLGAIAALVAYDVRRHGSLRASSTGHFLQDVGALPFVEQGWNHTQSYSQLSWSWAQKHGFEYYQQACETSQPYLLKAQDLLLAGANQALAGCQTTYTYAQEKAPLVSEWIEQWAPGLRDRTVEFGVQVWEQGKMYSIAGGKALFNYGEEAVSWARTNVFVGTWSPDNLQQYSLAVLNVTQQYALGTYDWLYEKVQTFSKVE